MSAEYVELLEEARAALYDLIKATEPGTGLTFHHAYADIKRCLEREGKKAVAEAPVRDYYAEQREREEAWRQTPKHEQERILLDVLQDKRLTMTEIRLRLNEAHEDRFLFYQGPVKTLLTRMLEAGEVDREGEYRSNGSLWRWRYFRNTKLSGEIADLNRQLGSE